MALLSVNMIVLCSSSNFLGSFLIALIGIIVICKKDYDELSTMFVVGGVTSFLDLLVTPMASYTLVMNMLLIKRDVKHENEKIKDRFIFLLKCSISWCTGYLGLWMSKWILSSIILRKNIILDAYLETKKYGIQSSEYDMKNGRDALTLILKEIKQIFPINLVDWNSLLGKMLLMILVCILLFLLYRIIKEKSNYIFYLLVGCAPYVWFLACPGHSWVHFWFTYRSQVGTVFALIFVCFNRPFVKNSKREILKEIHE